MPTNTGVSVELTADMLNIDMEKWITEKLKKCIFNSNDIITNTSSTPGKGEASRLRSDVRIVKTLEAVRDGIVSVQDAALAILKEKGVDLVQPMGKVEANMYEASLAADNSMQQTLMGIPVVFSNNLKPGEVVLANDSSGNKYIIGK